MRRRDDPELRASCCPFPHAQQRRGGSTALLALLCELFFGFSIGFGSVLCSGSTLLASMPSSHDDVRRRRRGGKRMPCGMETGASGETAHAGWVRVRVGSERARGMVTYLY